MTSRFEPILRFAHAHRRRASSAAYAVLTALALWFAFHLRFELAWPPGQRELFWLALPWLVLIRVACGYGFRLTTGRWRFVGLSDLARLTGSIATGSAIYFALSWIVPLLPRVPRSVLLIEAALTQLLIASLWISYRMAFEHFRTVHIPRGQRRRVLLVGAGEAGQMLVREMQRTPTGMLPVGFVDDDRVKWGTRIHGVRVQGAVADLPSLVSRLSVDEIVIAIPSARPAAVRTIVELCERAGKRFFILPGIAEVIKGEAHLSQLRDVQVEDLLGRAPIDLELDAIRADVEGRTVLITGAAGSIGSELARQIALHEPDRLVVADQSETPLFYLDLELRAEFPDVDVVAVVADIAREDAVESLFAEHAPDRVFHAAAYKHVPLMERHPLEATRNNILGTWLVADAAGRHGTERVVLVSTDKAVRPANIMGATKRMAELVVLEAQRLHPETAYGAVRFGNVLGSAGSVIPVFRRQLAEGRPLTITHEDVSRYFMTIPEAVQLILKASLLPELKGHVAMLEMGEPVKILDMARNLLRSVGSPYRPGENVVFTGLRPGEKMEEELVAPEERVVPTHVEKVRVVVSDRSRSPTEGWLSEMELQALRQGSPERVLDFMYGRFPAVATAPEQHIPSAIV